MLIFNMVCICIYTYDHYSTFLVFASKFIRRYQGAYMAFSCALARFSNCTIYIWYLNYSHKKCILLYTYIYFCWIKSNISNELLVLFFPFILRSTPSSWTYLIFIQVFWLFINIWRARVSVFSNLWTNGKKKTYLQTEIYCCWFTCAFLFICAWHNGSMGSHFFLAWKYFVLVKKNETFATENSSLKLRARVFGSCI